MKRAVAVPPDFDPVPSLADGAGFTASAVDAVPAAATVVGHLVAPDGDVPADLGVGRAELTAAGFTGAVGQALLLVRDGGPLAVAIGSGGSTRDAVALRDAAAAFSKAVPGHTDLAIVAPGATTDGAGALVEGAVLARYRYDALRGAPRGEALTSVAVVVGPDAVSAAADGVARGRVLAIAGSLARDLANTPPAHLTARRIADLAVELGPSRGLEIEVFEEDALAELGCGGLLGVNGGSAEPARMVKLTYSPEAADAPHLTLVGKGIMYDSGGISLKPSDAVHASMKNDMSGAGAVFAVMWALAELRCPTKVTAFLMCTDNMPSGTAMALGDVITIRGGTTVEVVNTDAEGRLVMADALVLGTEVPTDAIVDIATLTGACMRALGTSVAGIMGNDQALIGQLTTSGERTDEPLWQLPLEARYRGEIDSEIADLKNLGGPNGGAIHAALFLAEFVGDTPWAHVDIAGTADAAAPVAWRTKGCTGFGARLLIDFALGFQPTR